MPTGLLGARSVSRVPRALRALLGQLTLFVLAFVLLAAPVRAAEAPVVQLRAGLQQVQLWPALELQLDPSHRLGLRELLAAPAGFQRPDGPEANLGRRSETVWLRLRLQREADAEPRWWLRLDHLPIEEVELFLLDAAGELRTHALMGQQLRFAERTLPLRTHAAELLMEQPGDYQLLLRLRKPGGQALLVPLSLHAPQDLLRTEAREQFGFGLLGGIGLLMTAYGLLVALLARERLYLWYAAYAAGFTLLCLSYFGLAGQHLGPEGNWWLREAPRLLLMLVPAAAFGFVDLALDLPRHRPALSRLLRVLCGLLVLMALLTGVGLLPRGVVALVLPLVGPLPLLLGLPTAWSLSRQGEPVAPWVLAGWLFQGLGLAVGTALHLGLLAWSPASDLALTVGGLLDLLAWAVAMTLHSNRQRERARQVEAEQRLRQESAQRRPGSDLPSLQGLREALQQQLAATGPGQGPWVLQALHVSGLDEIRRVHGVPAAQRVEQELGQRLAHWPGLLGHVDDDAIYLLRPAADDGEPPLAMAQELLARLGAAIPLEGAVCRLGLALRYTTLEPPLDAERLLRALEPCLQQARRARRSTVGEAKLAG